MAQVRLLLSTLPDIARETVFGLKGGTAINLFYRDMPRLSVDIDLTYLPLADRQSLLKGIDDGCATHQRSVARKPRPCSGASSLAGSPRVPSTPNAMPGPRVQRTPVRHARPPVSESASPA